MLVITIVMIITKENNDDSKWLAHENIETTDDIEFITEMETKPNMNKYRGNASNLNAFKQHWESPFYGGSLF